MPDFSIIMQTPEVRGVVQDRFLERAMHDALFPRTLFRAEATPIPWPAGVGDTMVFTAPGLIQVDARPLTPGQDPDPVTYPLEQWMAQLQTYGGSIDTHMPTSITAIVNLFLRNGHQLSLMAAQTTNRIVRNRLYAAALSGWTVANGAQAGPTTSLAVKRLNGFTTARNTTGSGTNTIRFETVSSTNPLPIVVYANGAATAVNVIGYTATVPGDLTGPGTLTLSAAVSNVLDRAYVYALDRTDIVRSGGGFKVDDLTASTDLPTLSDVRSIIAGLWTDNVPEHADGKFHAQLDPVSQAKLFADAELQRLLTALPDYYMYKDFALGQLLNTVFLRNSEGPAPETVIGGLTASYDARDPFPGELWNNGASTGAKVHRILFTGQGAIMEYYQDPDQLLTEAGIMGKVGEPQINNNSIEVAADRIQLIIRAPQNRMQDQVSTTWKFIGDWAMRTDVATGGVGRYKRARVIEHTE